MNVKNMRGKQVTIGRLAVQIPQAPPSSDEEVVEHEQTIARIFAEIAAPEALVKVAKQIVELIREDIRVAMDLREVEERTGVKQNELPGTSLAIRKPRRSHG